MKEKGMTAVIEKPAFELTQEQKDIINTLYSDEKVIKINAFAGCGKTSTLVEVVKEIRKTDKDSKILYVVFNRSMLEDAKQKFEGLNVECQTTHGFALKRFSAIKKGELEVIPALDFNMFMEMKNNKKYVKSWVRFKTINEILNAYCLTYDDMDTFIENLHKRNDYNITEKISLTERDFFVDLYNYMVENNFYTHGMYLKTYACECRDKITSYKYLILDENQDTNLFFYKILKRIKCDKMFMCGDQYQNIYGFTKTVNMFKKMDGKTFPLSDSFRFNDEICKLANKILESRYKDFPKNAIKNYFNKTEVKDKTKKTILFRLNSTLFEYATDLISKVDNIKVHFISNSTNGRTDSFEECFNDMLYFYYHLLNSFDSEKAECFKRNFRFTTCKLVDNYIKICKKENMGLYNYLCRNKCVLPLDYVKYFNFFLLNELDIIDVVNKVKNSEDCKNPNREYFLMSAHSAKGLQWEHVKVAPDRWSINSDDEANLCYVAVTRAISKLDAQPIIDLLEESN